MSPGDALFANILRYGSISGRTRTRASRVVHFTARRSAFSVAARCSTMQRACWPSASAQTSRHSALMSPARSLGHKRTQGTPTMRHTRIELSHFVFPDCESSPRCATDLVFYRCMRMSPLAPLAGGAFLCALCATGAASGFRHRNQRRGSVLSAGFATSPASP